MVYDIERSQLIDLLERAAAKLEGQGSAEDQEAPDLEWSALVTGVLELPLSYLLAVQLAILQSRWRNAKHPKAYLRKVARLKAREMHSTHDRKSTLTIPENLRNDEGQPLSLEDYLDLTSSDVGAVKSGGRWKARNPGEEEGFYDDEGRPIPCVKGRPVPEDLLVLEDDEPDAQLVVNFEKVAERAGLNNAAMKVLEYQLAGFTREFVLEHLAQDDKERRTMQAAWRWLTDHWDEVERVLTGEWK
ncbi:MAG: hypothetical protein ACR2IV_05920 [Bryobacteraceae bacterium]